MGETAARASDTVARKLIAKGEKDHKLNFPNDETEMYPEKTYNYFGIRYNKRDEMWRTYRWSKKEDKTVHNGSYKDKETAARASDTLAKKLMVNGEKGHKLNFPDDETEVYPEQKTNYFGVSYNKLRATWEACRRSKNEKKTVFNGTYKNEETAAHASDTLAKTLIEN